MANYYPFLDDNKGDLYDIYRPDGSKLDDEILTGTVYHAPAFAHVEFRLTNGQEVLADGGAMIWKDAGLEISTKVGDCMPACWRKCAGESCCQNKFTGPGRVAFSFKLPGDMKPFSLTQDDDGWKLQAGAFVCGTVNCVVSTTFAGCYACICGAEEVWLSKVELDDDSNDTGVFYAGGYGAITRHDISENDTICMSSGLFFATEMGIPFTLRMPGGCFSCLFGGEGLVCAIEGPAIVYTQNRNPAIWKHILRRETQKKQDPNGSAMAGA